MNAEIKRHIDSARQVLVGVVPNPTSQIDQITNALIYKFMDDMDQASIKAGGAPSFFVHDLEPYAWTRLMDARVGNQERMNLYSEALIKFSQAKQLPELFRDIFKSAFLPYRSPEILGLFLKEISFFDYTHPEDLGDAYEYLLSIMSSQGDAGQFRTPRHIIDFIVAVVNPTVSDKVLDPACGTGGFLVSSYNHILRQHDGIDDPGKKEIPLTPDQRKKLMANFEGYDIDPTMVRIAQVNMYLHQFKNPKIYQYDSLGQEERWGDKFDVVLANPPFMSPKGGVMPHSKFSISSSRSEVLFVDYIMNHLRPNGRAGIIVPEGIIFQSGSAHKQLRKNLIEDGLYAVVSLPSGVFAPYSGVKTSILLFDMELSKRIDNVLFIDIKDTGISLGTTQRPIEKNDLIPASEIIQKFRIGEEIESSKLAFAVPKQEIIDFAYDLSMAKYRKHKTVNPAAPLVALSEICTIKKGKSSSTKTEPGIFPLVLMAENNRTAGHYDFEGEGVCVPLMTAASTGVAVMKRVHYVKGKFALANLLAFVEPKDASKVNSRYLYNVLLTSKDELADLMKGAANVSMKTYDLETFKIPLPSIEIQEQIVAELDGYAGIIAGAKQIAQNWKPKIEIDSEWEKLKLGEVCSIKSTLIDPRENGFLELIHVGAGNIESNSGELHDLKTSKEENLISAKFLFDEEMVLYSKIRPYLVKVARPNFKGLCSADIYPLLPEKEKIIKDFLYYILSSDEFTDYAIKGSGRVGMPKVNREHLFEFEVPLPSIDIQKQIVEKIEAERILVESAKKLIEIYEQKTKETIAKLWAE